MKVMLFDMDGTLTKPREKINTKMIRSLASLQDSGYEVGVVTGSGMKYINEQCHLMFDINGFDHTKVHWLPCNGTKYYKHETDSTIKCVYENDMIEEVGRKNYEKLIKICLNIQRHIIEETDCPLTSNFFDYRESMLNWCPIGRGAQSEQRKAWKVIDRDSLVRSRWMTHLKYMLEKHGILNVDVRLGGDTSFDIHPIGWDKTYCLRNFTNYKKVVFIGDRCDKNGNDETIYNQVLNSKNGAAYKTTSPTQTIEIINTVLNKESE